MHFRQSIKLFRDGPYQTIHIPRGLELPGDEATIRRQGNTLIVEAVPTKSLLAVLAHLAPIDEEPQGIEDFPPDPVNCGDNR